MSAGEENVEIIRQWWARFNETGEPALDLCDPAVEMRNPDQFLVRGPYHGHDGIRQWREDVFDVIDDARVEIEELLDAGDGESVVAVLRLKGTAKYTRIDVDAPWAAVVKLRDGKMFHAQGYLSRHEALEAAGTG